MEFWIVMFRAVPLVTTLTSKFSSLPQLMEQWSITMFSTVSFLHAVILKLSSYFEGFVPYLNLRCLMMTFDDSTNKCPSLIRIPPPGAVCPAMVTLPLLMGKTLFKVIVPPTSKIMVRGPELYCRACLKLPGPLSLRFVTLITAPPLPPVAYLPKPSAVGKALIFCGWEKEICDADINITNRDKVNLLQM